MVQRKSKAKGRARRKTRKKKTVLILRPAAFLLAAGLLLTAVSLYLVLDSPVRRDKAASPPTSTDRTVNSAGPPPPPVSRTSPGRIYEEQQGPALEQKIREVDLALLQALITSGVGSRGIVRHDVELRQRGQIQYQFQHLVLNIAGDKATFIDRLRSELASWVDAIALNQTDALGRFWEIRALGVPTHLITLNGRTAVDHERPAPHSSAGLTIVIDDLGENIASARRLSQLGIPITFSVLPSSTRTGEIAALAGSRGHELLLHLPMQPMGTEYTPGPGALYVDMDETTIRTILSRDLAQVPGAVGVNNHMGSRFTADSRGMAVVMQELGRQNLFFLDSLTTPESTAQEQARLHGTPYLQRHIFLDNEQDVEAILFQLKKAESLALREGAAIAIGHPYEATLEALARWARERDTRVRLMSLKQLSGRLPASMAAKKP